MRMCKSVGTTIAFGLAGLLAVNLGTPRPAEAFIHEIIGAMCRAGGEEVIPPGQVNGGLKSFTRALLATGFITSVVSSPTEVIINFDPDVPNSKFKDEGIGDVTIPNGAGPGVDLTLSPSIVLDPDFAAHVNCRNLKP